MQIIRILNSERRCAILKNYERDKDYPIVEHMSNARLMPMTGPYGGLDLFGSYEYGEVPSDPSTPLESYDVVMEKNRQKPPY